MKIHSSVQKLLVGDRQTGDLISPVFIFGKKANNEATKCCNVIPLDKEMKIVGKLLGGMIAAAGRLTFH
jgi:hypothetical protein